MFFFFTFKFTILLPVQIRESTYLDSCTCALFKFTDFGSSTTLTGIKMRLESDNLYMDT